jgi:hypothetical protein
LKEFLKLPPEVQKYILTMTHELGPDFNGDIQDGKTLYLDIKGCLTIGIGHNLEQKDKE